MMRFARMRSGLAVTASLLAALVTMIGFNAPIAMAAAVTNGNIAVSANPWPPVAGRPVTVTGTVTWHNIPGKTEYQCSQWTLTFDGQTVSGGSDTARTSAATTTFSHVFSAPADAGSRSNVAQSSCMVRNALAYGLINIDPVLTSETLTARSTPSTTSGSLPNTGGPSVWWLVGGLMLLVAGGGLVRQRR